MASFKDAFEKVSLSEGSYVNDKDDNGGETYMGISRKFNNEWLGWKIIDSHKKFYKGKEFIDRLKSDNKLQELVKSLYKNNYWDCFELDDVPSQLVAFQIFDTNVNCGSKAAIKMAQRCLGLRENGRWTIDLLNQLIKIK